MLKEGIIASPGIAIAKAFVYDKVEVEVTEKKVDDPAAEVARLQAALEKSKEQILKIKEKASRDLGEEEAEIFEAHAMVLDDPEFVDSITAEINTNGVNAEFAVKTVTDRFFEMFDMMDDPYFSARAADIRDVGTRVLNNVMGVENVDISCLDEDTIIVADDLAPSDTAQMDKARVKGFATNIGSRTSHTAIMARSLEIPAVLGLGDITAAVKNGDMVVVDGLKGQAVINPTDGELAAYQKQQEDYQAYIKELAELKELEAVTTDGHKVELVGNIGSPNDTDGVHKNGGRGVGLYRTEFLYMNSDTMPDEEKQYEAYKAVVESFNGDPVIIRTLDIGGDKEIPYMGLEKDENPFLGYRAIRFCLDRREDVYKPQLRALLRASAFGNIRIMVPLVTCIEEFREAKALVEELKAELDSKGIAYNKDIQVGIMVETAAASLIADIFAKEADFFSIGTNDLTQYTMSVDRGNKKVSYLYSTFNPAVLRSIRHIIACGREAGIMVGMCGEAASDPMMIPLLLAFGLNEFSMSASAMLKARKMVMSYSTKELQAVAQKAMSFATAAETEQYMKEFVENGTV